MSLEGGIAVTHYMLIVSLSLFLFLFVFLSLSVSCSRYTDTVMNSYQSMSVPASASASFAQFYQHAAAASAVSAASAGAIGVDSLGNACTQPASGVVPGAGGAGQSIADLPRYPWMTLTGESREESSSSSSRRCRWSCSCTEHLLTHTQIHTLSLTHTHTDRATVVYSLVYID